MSSSSSPSTPICWTITNGSAGMVSQVTGIAEALLPLIPGLTIKHLRCQRRLPWRLLPNAWHYGALNQCTEDSNPLAGPPWPDIVITCGRQAVPLALEIKRKSAESGKKGAFIIHTQNPYVHPSKFDLLLLPEHDRLTGENIINSRWALHKITNAKLQEANKHFAPLFAAYEAPYLAVLLGGTTNKFTMTQAAFDDIIKQLDTMLASWKGSMLITPSRRTGDAYIQALIKHYQHNPRVYVYDMVSENPYFGFLALASSFAITDDSVNMISEACFTQKPVYIIPLKGHKKSRPKQFVTGLIEQGILRLFEGNFATWNYPRSDEMTQIARAIAIRYLAEHP